MKLLRLLSLVVLAGCGRPFWHIPQAPPQSMANPPRSVAEIAAIEVYQDGCLGTCPVYRFAIASTGLARYEGLCYTPILGTYEAQADVATFRILAGSLLASDFFQTDSIVNLVLDAPSTSVTVTLADGRSRLVQYGPFRREYLPELTRLLSVLRWQPVGPRPTLDRYAHCAT